MMEYEIAAPLLDVVEEIENAGGETSRYCFQCGRCDSYCPWNRVKPFSIRRLVREANFGLSEIESDDVWRCTTCGTCPPKCPRGVEQINVVTSLRQMAFNYDIFSTSSRTIRSLVPGLLLEGNPLNEKRAHRGKWAETAGVKKFEEGMDLLYFPCCYPSYDPRMKKVAIATAKILQSAGVNFGILGSEENCCGESIRKAGSVSTFKTLAKENIKSFIQNGVKKILVSSPHCFHTFKNEYPEFMVKFEVIHISQFLAELIEKGKIKLHRSLNKTVTYHDPCYLGRHNGIFDEPRKVLKSISGIDFVEMKESREESLCCGGGGGRIWMDTPQGERFSDIRLNQAIETGAEILVTCCPYCITNFEASRLTLEKEDTIEVKDITEIVWESMQNE